MGAVQSRLHDYDARPRAEPFRPIRQSLQLRRAKREQQLQLHIDGIERGECDAFGDGTAAGFGSFKFNKSERSDHCAVKRCYNCRDFNDNCHCIENEKLIGSAHF